jgi:hypothetical protein
VYDWKVSVSDEMETLTGSGRGIFHGGAEEIHDASCVRIAYIGPRI